MNNFINLKSSFIDHFVSLQENKDLFEAYSWINNYSLKYQRLTIRTPSGISPHLVMMII